MNGIQPHTTYLCSRICNGDLNTSKLTPPLHELTYTTDVLKSRHCLMLQKKYMKYMKDKMNDDKYGL